MAEIRVLFQEIPLADLKYYLPTRSREDIPEEHFAEIKADMAINGLLRPIRVNAHLGDITFDVTRSIIQDGFVRFEAAKELNSEGNENFTSGKIPCETHFFVSDHGIEIGTVFETVPIGDIEDPHEADARVHLINPPAFVSEEEFDVGAPDQNYSEAKAAYEAEATKYTARIADITTNGQDTHLAAFKKVTNNEDGHWIYGSVCSQDSATLIACKEAGLTELSCKIRLLDYRIGV